jgi:uncharacterized protein (TIGR00255 family)
MIQSMTGFGEAQTDSAGHVYHLDLRSVNHRYFKAAIYLPEDLAFLEPEVEGLLRGKLTRGSLTYRLRIRDLTAAAAAEINRPAIERYVEQLSAAAGTGRNGLRIDLATLATLPGVCLPRELSDQERDKHWAVVERLTGEALTRLVEMRTVEGRSLAADLVGHCAVVRAQLKVVHDRVPIVVKEYADRLASRVRELIADRNVSLAEEDLLREVSIFAERSDISEEINRLGAHLDQFAEVMDNDSAAGRKLEFLAQEMLREANTMGSKAGDTQIARAIIEIKSAIDRIKEQVQNVE